MSQAQYTAIQQASLSTLDSMTPLDFMLWLTTKPDWMQQSIMRQLNH